MLINRIFRRLAYERANYSQALRDQRLRFVSGMATDNVDGPPSDPVLLRRLCDSYLAAKAHQEDLTGPYAPAVEWKRLLDSEWQRPRDIMQRGDLEGLGCFLANFFRNEGLSGFWGGDHMFQRFQHDSWVRRSTRAGTMDRQVETWREYLPDAPIAELAAPPIGNPWGYRIGDYLVYEPACEYHLEAALCAKFLNGVDAPVVLEIGGGFGGFAWHALRRLPGMKYIGLDLPEAALLQAFYLGSAYPDLRLITWVPDMGPVDDAMIAQHDIIIIPNFAMPTIADASVDLVVNSRSLSEMPPKTIAEYLRQIDRLGRRFFFHENIYRERSDGLHGVPSVHFPAMDSFVELFSVESRWPKYDRRAGYSCRENLLIHRTYGRR